MLPVELSARKIYKSSFLIEDDTAADSITGKKAAKSGSISQRGLPERPGDTLFSAC